MPRKALVWCCLLWATVLLSACGSATLRAQQVEPPTAAADFVLTDQNGQPFHLADQKGNVVVLFFGFTTCPDVCPTTLSDLAAVREQLGADAEHVRVAMITVDPERDTQAALARYVKRFDPTFTGLYGTPEALEAARKPYGVTAIKREMPNSAMKYTVDHSSYLYVIDTQGRWRSFFTFGTPVDDMVNDLRILARERTS